MPGAGVEQRIALILPTKGLLPDSGGIGNQWFIDRAGITRARSRTARACSTPSRILSTGYSDPRDPFTACRRALIREQPYAASLIDATLAAAKPLQGMRIAILREHMVKPTPNHEAISDQIDGRSRRFCAMRSAQSSSSRITPEYPDDPDVPNLSTRSRTRCRRLLPRFMPEIFSRRTQYGELFFAVPGHDVTRTTTC